MSIKKDAYCTYSLNSTPSLTYNSNKNKTHDNKSLNYLKNSSDVMNEKKSIKVLKQSILNEIEAKKLKFPNSMDSPNSSCTNLETNFNNFWEKFS